MHYRKADDRDNHLIIEAENRAFRQDISNLIDELFVAFRESGGSGEEYLRVQWWEGQLYQSVNLKVYSPLEEHGALKLIILFLNRLIAHYQAIQAEREAKEHGKKGQDTGLGHGV